MIRQTRTTAGHLPGRPPLAPRSYPVPRASPTPAPIPTSLSARADPAKMTPAQFAKVLNSLGWTSHVLARALACSEKLVRNWIAGENPVPAPVAVWLWSLTVAMRLYPPPAPSEWRTVRPPGPRHGRVRKGKSRAPAGEKSN